MKGSKATPNERRKENHGPPTREAITREEMHRWERHIRGFRSEHHFTLTTGVTSGKWRVKRLGSLSDVTYKGSGFMSRFQYSFHLQLYRGLGYFLGSSLGYHYESSDLRLNFRPTPAIQYPGLVAGVVVNLSPMFRALLAADTYLERHDGIDAGQGSDATSIYVTMKAFEVGAAIDIFYDLLWAFRIEAHKRHLAYNRPIISSSQADTSSYPVDAVFSKDDEWLGVGLVFHLL